MEECTCKTVLCKDCIWSGRYWFDFSCDFKEGFKLVEFKPNEKDQKFGVEKKARILLKSTVSGYMEVREFDIYKSDSDVTVN